MSRLHWYLAIIYNPGALLRATSDKKDEPKESSTEVLPSEDLRAANLGHEQSCDDEEEVEEGLEAVDAIDSVAGDIEMDNTNRSRSETPDPLDCIPTKVTTNPNAAEEILEGMEGLEMAASRESSTKAQSPTKQRSPTKEQSPSTESSNARPGQAIDEDVLMGLGRVDHREPDAGQAAKTNSADKPEKLADHDIVSSDRLVSSGCINRREADSDRTWIITFDSLGKAHKAVANTLARWLKSEAKDKKGVEIDVSDQHVSYTYAQVSGVYNSTNQD